MFHWDATKVANWSEVEDALKTSIDFILMGIGFGTITEANAAEVFRRTNILERATGAFRQHLPEVGKPEQVFVTPDEVRSLIGYSVNVSQKSKAQFKNDLFRTLEQRVSKFEPTV